MWKDEKAAPLFPHRPHYFGCGVRHSLSPAHGAHHHQFLYDQSEITANYGQVFATAKQGTSYIADTINLKFIPDKVSFSQYITVLFRSPDYLLKFWNSVILVVPIVILQLIIASIAAYGFTRWRGKVSDVIFFSYVILMLMPYQVTLVPNYLVSDWLGILNTRWAIILPGAFAPFSVFLLTKFMRRIPIPSLRRPSWTAPASSRSSRTSACPSAAAPSIPSPFWCSSTTGIWWSSR